MSATSAGKVVLVSHALCPYVQRAAIVLRRRRAPRQARRSPHEPPHAPHLLVTGVQRRFM